MIYATFLHIPVFAWLIFVGSIIMMFLCRFAHLKNISFKHGNVDYLISCIGGSLGIGSIIAGIVSVQISQPGVLLWILLVSIFTSVIKFYEVYFSCDSNSNKNPKKGPMRYMQNVFTKSTGLKYLNKLSYFVFVVCFAIGYFFTTILQINQVALSLSFDCQILQYVCYFILCIICCYYLLNDFSKILQISKILVPFMLIAQTFICVSIIMNAQNVFDKFLFLLHNAFEFQNFSFGCIIGIALQRIILSADLGTGISGLLNAQNKNANRLYQGSIATLENIAVGFNIFFIGFAIYVSGFLNKGVGIEPLLYATKNISYFHYILLICTVFLFGFTTMITRFYAAIFPIFMTFKNIHRKKICFCIFIIMIMIAKIEFKKLLNITDTMLVWCMILNVLSMIIFAKRKQNI